MRAYKIIFCLGDTYQKEQCQEKTVEQTDYEQALTALYLSFWGTPVFVTEIKEIYIP